MSLLLNHPEVLQKVRTDIDSQVKRRGRLLNDSAFAKLPHLCCVINERVLNPPQPFLLPHFPSEDCIVGEFHIQRRTILLVNAWFMHRNPKLWEEPNRFKPKRFEVTIGEREGFKQIPFGIMRRPCQVRAWPSGNFRWHWLHSFSNLFGERVGKEVADMNQILDFFCQSLFRPFVVHALLGLTYVLKSNYIILQKYDNGIFFPFT